MLDIDLIEKAKTEIGYGTNTGHGHVWKRPDGSLCRCGGPSLCSECAKQKAQLDGFLETSCKYSKLGKSSRPTPELFELVRLLWRDNDFRGFIHPAVAKRVSVALDEAIAEWNPTGPESSN